ncbi:MAG: CHAT domain-containing protein [Coleofasciculus sp. B1-GNL1-01]|uniref:CHAT domain-containing protein n=1 Tax=Coleofasciculus sp. B1-GNL1-01 TaxID=3068484 RepID=UPI0032F928DF
MTYKMNTTVLTNCWLVVANLFTMTKKKSKRSHYLLLTLLLAGLPTGGLAQSVVEAPDGTGTIVTPNGDQFDITGGQTSGDGANLFHSFSEFGLEANQTATFSPDSNIQNIFARVTSGNPSIINGLLEVTGGNPNLFLMNPAGIVFGQNARLNVPASFTATTATGIGIGDNWFNAIGSNDYTALVGEPNAFAFSTSQTPGAIVNAGLELEEAQSLNLFGGIVVSTDNLEAPEAEITIATVPGERILRISQPGNVLSLEVQPSASVPLTPLTLPQLLTGSGQISGLEVDSDGQVTRVDSSIPTQNGIPIKNGDINVGNIDTSVTGRDDAGSVVLSAQSNLTVGDITATAVGQGDSGNVTLSAQGSIYHGTIDATHTGNPGQGNQGAGEGAINLTTPGETTTETGFVEADNLGTTIEPINNNDDDMDDGIDDDDDINNDDMDNDIDDDDNIDAQKEPNLPQVLIYQRSIIDEFPLKDILPNQNSTPDSVLTVDENATPTTVSDSEDLGTSTPTTANEGNQSPTGSNQPTATQEPSNTNSPVNSTQTNPVGETDNNQSTATQEQSETNSPVNSTQTNPVGEIGSNQSTTTQEPSNTNSSANSTQTNPVAETDNNQSTTTQEQSERNPPIDSTQTDSVAEFEEKFTRQFEEYLELPGDISLRTLAESREILANTEKSTGAKPALIYVSFAPQTIATDEATNVPFPTPSPQDQLEILLVTAQGTPIRKKVEGVTREQVLKVANEFRLQVTNVRSQKGYIVPGQQLYNWLVKPLEDEFQGQGIENLIFLLDTNLRSVPVAALYDGEQFLIEKYSVGLMPSLSLTDTRYEPVTNMEVLAMGASQFTDKQPLPAVPVELSEITQDIWQGKSFLNESFTVNNLKQQQNRQPYGMIHLATHADFVPGEMSNSYIQFWDSKLRLNQLSELGLNKPTVELLVLSSCRTALGNEEAELGFAGLAVKAGVKSAVGSLWYVSDQGTLGLITEFYQQLKQAPIKAEAMRQAQLAMLNGQVYTQDGKLITTQDMISLPPELARLRNQTFEHPYYWSAFTMIGSPW